MKKTTFSPAFLAAAVLLAPPLAQGQGAPGGRPTTAPAAAPRATGRLTGTVLEAATGKPVSYATVAVLDAAGASVNGGVCGDDGKFVLPGIPAGTYTIRVSFIGLKEETRSNVEVTAGGTTALGTIQLAASAQALTEVKVTGRKPLIEERVDRTIYNADVDKTTAGGDGTDVLRRVPLLSVDLDGNVSLRGSSNIRVLINNKPSTIAASSVADALKQIPADQIQTVEVITSPSAKYDAEGTGGIINIITKTNDLRGGSVGINTGVGLRGTNLSVNGNYRTGKFGASLGGFGRAGYNQPGRFENTQSSVGFSRDPNNPNNLLINRTTVQQSAETRRNDIFGRYTLGLSYDFDKRNSLQGSLAYGIRNADNYQDNLTSNTLAGRTTGVNQVRDVQQLNHSGTVDASLNYTHTFEVEQRELSVQGLFSRNNQTNDFTNDVYTPSDRRYLGQLGNNNDSHNQEITAQVDYQTPTVKNQLLEAGAKDIVRRVTSTYNYFGDTSLQPIQTPSNSFVYRQNVAAGYVTYTVGLPKGFTLKPGVRYEYTSISADFGQGTVGNIPNYGIVVPGVNLSRKFENGDIIKLAYNRRIQRPSLQFLNPNVQAPNPLNATQGNPELEPEKTNNVEVGYSTQIKQKVTTNFSGFVRNTNNSIQAIRTPEANGALLTTYLNAGTENAYGGSLFVGINTGKLSVNGSFDGFYAVLRNNNPDPVYNSRNEGFVASGRGFVSYNFNDKWALQGFGFYRGRQVQLQGYQSGFGIYSLSIQRNFAEKRGSIGFGAENFFTGTINQRTEVSTPYVGTYNYNGAPIVLNGPVLSQQSTNIIHNLSFKVNFSYRIGKLTAGARSRKGISNDDLKEGGDSGFGGGGDAGGQGGGQGQSGGRPGQGPGGQRPGGAPGTNGQRPGGYPGASQRPDARPDSTRTTAPAGSLQPGATPPGGVGGRPAEGTAPTQPAANPTAQPAASPGTKPANVPVGAPSPGTTSPGGTTPAGEPGGRP